MEKRIGTHIMSTFLVILLLLGAFFVIVPGEAVALQDGDFVYTTSGNPLVATLTEYAGAGGAVDIPATLGGFTTAAIGSEAFNNGHGYMVTSVKIPDSVRSIGNHVFANCNLLVTVEIGSGVSSIDQEPFYGCSSLTSVTVDVDNHFYTSNFGVLYNKNQTTLINCPAAKAGQVIIPNTVTIIDWMAFDHRTQLSSVTIGSGVRSIADYAFQYCTSLTTVTFAPSSSLTTIGNRSFFYCTSLTSIDLPSSVTTIGNAAFRLCTSVTSLTIPDGVKFIDDEAFVSCDSLTSVTIPGSVTFIGRFAFVCASLTSINVNGSNPNYASVDHVLYNKTLTTLIQYPCGRSGSFTIPDSVVEIGEAAFNGCANLTSVKLGSNVSMIDEYAFGGCTNLTTITIPSSVDQIGMGAFASCSKLTNVNMSFGITTIGVYAFMSCTSLASITIPASVTSIDVGAFYSCTHLTSITFLGLISPETGLDWIKTTALAIRGHAYAASNFPVPGITFYGLTMGANVAPSVPGAPTNISTSPGDSHAIVTWVAPIEIGGSPVTGYKVYRSATETGNYTLIASPTSMTYNDTGAINGQTYWYKVSAVNIVGEGAQSIAASVVLPSPASPASDNAMLILLAIIAIMVALVAVALLVLRKRKK